MRELLSEVAGTSISGRDPRPRYRDSLIWLPDYRLKHPPQRAVAQRLCALTPSVGASTVSTLRLSGVLRTTFPHSEYFGPLPQADELSAKMLQCTFSVGASVE